MSGFAATSVRNRLPVNNKVACLGDSIPYAGSFAASATNVKLYAKSYINWAQFLGRQRWTFDHANNFGNPGDTTTQVLARADAALASMTAGTVLLDCLTNDGPNSISVATSQSNYQAIINKILAAGRIVVCITPRPRDITASGLTMTAQQARDHCARRDYVLGLHAPYNGIYVVDMWRYLADPASTNMAARSNYTYDGLHPSVLGGYWGGKALAELFGSDRNPGLFPFIDVMVGQNVDVWNAAYVRGTVNSNPMLQGTSSGTATGYTTTALSNGVTAVAAKVAGTAPLTDVQQITLGGTGTGNADVYDFYQTISAGNLTIGDTLEAYADVEYDSLSGLSSHGLVMVDTTTFTDIAGHMIDSSDINAMSFVLPAAVKGVMRTPRLTIANTTIRAGFKGRAINAQAVSGVYRINAMAIRKV